MAEKLTLRQQPDVLNPDYRNIEVLAGTFVPDIRLFHSCRITAKELPLHFS